VQVFVNLITNACHAMPLGAGQAALLRPATSSEGRLLVRVIDSGKGITEDNLQRVFEPFFTTTGRRQRHGPRAVDREKHRGTTPRRDFGAERDSASARLSKSCCRAGPTHAENA